MVRTVAVAVSMALLAACEDNGQEHRSNTDGPDAADGPVTPSVDAADGTGGTDAPPEAAVPDPHACSDLFSPDVVRTYEVEISQEQWAKLEHQFRNPVLNEEQNGYVHTYFPIVFHTNGETRTDAMIRLKGTSSWLDTITNDSNPKAQFVIAFDQVDNNAYFHDVSKIVLDMPRTDPTYLRERLGMTVMRELGFAGVCAASARLVINGQYYGLYAAEETMGHRTLKRIFPAAHSGDLWKSGYWLETNEASANYARQLQWSAASDLASMEKIIDVDQALSEWAAEIVINNGDGYYGGDHNFYVYDYPGKGFVWIPNDLDSSFDYLENAMGPSAYTANPIYWWEDHDGNQTAPDHWRVVMNDAVGRARLVEAVAGILSRWDAAHIQSLIDHWAPMITAAVEQDPHRWATMEHHVQSIAALRAIVVTRPQFLQGWVQCERTNSGTDADGDGYPWCRDCNDQQGAIHPGASESCGDGVDNDCDGLKDDGC